MASARVYGPLDIAKLQASIIALLERHESLRTRLVPIDGTPQQVIDPPNATPLPLVELRHLSKAEAESEVALLTEEFSRTNVDMAVGPAFEAKLLRVSDTDHVVLIGVDHMISDAASCSIIYRDLWTLYDRAVLGTRRDLPQLCTQFGDYAVWQQRSYPAWLDEHGSYWRTRLANLPSVSLPDAAAASVRETLSSQPLQFSFGMQLSALMREAAVRERTLLPLVALTAYAALIWRRCGQERLLVESVSHGRHGNPELRNMVGFLASRMYLVLDVQPQDTLIDLLKRVTQELYRAYQHHDYGRVPDLIPDCHAQLYFNWLPSNWSGSSCREPVGATDETLIEPFRVPFARGGIDPCPSLQLSPLFVETEDGIELSVWYTPQQLPAAAIRRLAEDLQRLIEVFVHAPHTRLDSVALAGSSTGCDRVG